MVQGLFILFRLEIDELFDLTFGTNHLRIVNYR